jgi:hypothetical protein
MSGGASQSHAPYLPRELPSRIVHQRVQVDDDRRVIERVGHVHARVIIRVHHGYCVRGSRVDVKQSHKYTFYHTHTSATIDTNVDAPFRHAIDVAKYVALGEL